MTRVWQGAVVFLAVVTTAFSQKVSGLPATVDLHCGEDSVQITWTVAPEVMPHISRHFLGSCPPSSFSITPSGQAAVVFNSKLTDCRFRIRIRGTQLVYKNYLYYRPFAKPSPAAATHAFECSYKSVGYIPPFMAPGMGSMHGYGDLVFHMELLNEQRTALAKTNVFPLGSFISIWAAVEQGSHQPLRLLLEECVAAKSPELKPETPVYPIITNKGCLVDSKLGNSGFLTRYHSSSITLSLQAFTFGLGEDVYIHCKMVATDPEVLDESNKACHYIKETRAWELLDDPLQSDLCRCCETRCASRLKREVESETLGLVQQTVLGPLRIVKSPKPQQTVKALTITS